MADRTPTDRHAQMARYANEDFIRTLSGISVLLDQIAISPADEAGHNDEQALTRLSLSDYNISSVSSVESATSPGSASGQNDEAFTRLSLSDYNISGVSSVESATSPGSASGKNTEISVGAPARPSVDESRTSEGHVPGQNRAETLDIIYDMEGNEDIIAQAIFVFLTTHAPETENAPLQGIFQYVDTSCAIESVGVLLGPVSAQLVPRLQALFQDRLVQWPSLLDGLVRIPQFSGFDSIPTQEDSNDKVKLTKDHWMVLREMICASRYIEDSKVPRGGWCAVPFPRKGTYRDWAWSERLRLLETGDINKVFGASAAWYDTPATIKLKKLEQILDFVNRRLPLEKHCALRFDSVTASKLPNMDGLKKTLHRELRRWQPSVMFLRLARDWSLPCGELPAGISMNPVWSGFAHTRRYQRLPAPRPPTEGPEDVNQYPPGPLRDSTFKPRFSVPHPDLPLYKRSDLLDLFNPKLSAELDEQVALFSTPTASEKPDTPNRTSRCPQDMRNTRRRH